MTSSFLQHKAGPGCITYDANMAILQIATQIMRDYLEQQKYQTVTAQECADMASGCLMHMGEAEYKKACVDSSFKLLGGLAGVGMAATSLISGFKTSSKIGDINKSLENIDELTKQMEKPVINPSASTGAPGAPLTGAPIVAAAATIPETGTGALVQAVPAVTVAPGAGTVQISGKPVLLTKDDLEQHIPREVDRWCAGGCKDKLTINLPATTDRAAIAMKSEELNGIPDPNKAQIRRALKVQQDKIAHEKEAANATLQSMQNLSYTSQSLSQLIDSIGGFVSMGYALSRTQFEAAKTEVQQSQEFLKQVDGINSQGAQQAFDQVQKALQAYMSVVSANTRA